MSALAFGGVIVPKVNLVLTLICHNYLKGGSSLDPSNIFSSEIGDECRIPEVQSRVSIFKLAMSAISGSLAAIVAPKLGALSDRYGRTPMIVWINCGMIINEIITIFCAKFPDTVSVNWILVGAVFDGLGGSFIASMAISHSYAADCTPSSKRSVVFGYFHGCLFTGIAVSQCSLSEVLRDDC
jgi:MFS family permease